MEKVEAFVSGDDPIVTRAIFEIARVLTENKVDYFRGCIALKCLLEQTMRDHGITMEIIDRSAVN